MKKLEKKKKPRKQVEPSRCLGRGRVGSWTNKAREITQGSSTKLQKVTPFVLISCANFPQITQENVNLCPLWGN